MKTAIRCATFSLLALLTLAACGGESGPPGIISLPVGFQPEGIAARDSFIYVGSIPSGAVYRADISTGVGSVLVPSQAGRAAIGLKVTAAPASSWRVGPPARPSSTTPSPARISPPIP